jgi:hypothetical protein
MVLYEQFAVASWLRCLLHCLLHVWYFSHPFATRIRTKTSGVTLTPFTGIVVLLLGKRFQGAALASTSPRDSTEVLTASSPTRARRWGSFCSWAAGNLLRISAQRWCGIFVDLWCWAARPAGQIGPRAWLRVLCGLGRVCHFIYRWENWAARPLIPSHPICTGLPRSACPP